jgi:hypothetical protein
VISQTFWASASAESSRSLVLLYLYAIAALILLIYPDILTMRSLGNEIRLAECNFVSYDATTIESARYHPAWSSHPYHTNNMLILPYSSFIISLPKVDDNV